MPSHITPGGRRENSQKKKKHNAPGQFSRLSGSTPDFSGGGGGRLRAGRRSQKVYGIGLEILLLLDFLEIT